MKRRIYDTNRTVRLRNRKGHFWCGTCDMYLVHPGQKCPCCGHRPEKRRLRGDPT